MMAALVQSLPSPSTSTMTMLQTRSPSQDAFKNGTQAQQHQTGSQGPRNIYNTSVGGMAAGNYRGHPAASPLPPYQFQSVPMMQNGANPLRQHQTMAPHPRYDARTSSAPTIPVVQPQSAGTSSRPRPPPANSVSTPLNPSLAYPPLNQARPTDDGSLSGNNLGPSPAKSLAPLDLTLPPLQASYANAAKASPDRYKRNHQRSQTSGGLAGTPQPANSAMPSGSGMATVGHLYTHPNQTTSTPTLSTYPTYRGTPSPNASPSQDNGLSSHQRVPSKDDMNVQRQSSSEVAKRYRRRSISSLEVKDYSLPSSEPPAAQAKPKTYAAMLAGPAPVHETRGRPVHDRPGSAHGRKEGSEGGSSATSSAKSVSTKRGPETPSTTSVAQQATSVQKNEAKIVNVPARGSSEANKRLTTPSPLSQPMAMGSDPQARAEAASAQEQPRPTPSPVPAQLPQALIPESPAAQQLAALNKKEAKKEGKSSRLRRAFSFGSAAELRKASAENSANATRERNRLQKPQFADEEEAQQAAIAQQQEASGLGEGIYSGQGHFFTGSTDNLSISSTASSASVMIRKMGKGVKKGSRSLVGLFRPKSVVGVPAADSAVPEPSVAQVSMVTVEAEREKVNVNPNPHDQPGGGTGFPKLERNSLDVSAVKQGSDASPRRSIVGGERERAEVLAAVKKGILKRAGTDSGNSSPQPRPAESRPPNFNLPQIPRVNDSPNSSAPSTPVDEHAPRGHGKTDSVHIEGEEYFLSIQNYANNNASSTSMPSTPQAISRNISFSPRIQFHDTWPSMEYDRRGEIATCNRLTPMLAQQIKEELNTFKMEMEVHAESKINTHFF